MTTPHALHWDILRWNFDVEHIDMILRHNAQYRASLSGLPILVLECSKRDQLEREARQRGWKFVFFRRQTLMKWTETFTEQSQPLGPSFPPGFTSQVLWRYAPLCHTLSSGLTVGNSRPHPINTSDDSHLVFKALDCLLSLLLRTIGTAGISSWGRRQSRSSSAVAREGCPDGTRDDEAENCRLSAMRFVH